MIQREIPILSQQTEIIDLPTNIIACAKTFQEAVQVCMNQSRVKRTQTNWADLLDMSKGNLNLILNDSEKNTRHRYLNGNLINRIQRLAGNRGINQWLDLELRGELHHQSQKNRIKQLEAELDMLKEATA